MDILKPILKDTNGIIIYQEQIIEISSILASYSLGESDVLRRAISKKKEDILLKEKEKFINRCLKNNIPLEKASEIYDIRFSEYGFNKSHSVAYSTIAYKMAYLKYYYPLEFFSNLLTYNDQSSENLKDYINEIKKFKISLEKPDINISCDKYVVYENKIYLPFSKIKI